MTPEQQRVAIAETCGIKPTSAEWLRDGRTILVYLEDGKWLPDYFNDLNAMHSAEKFLKSKAQKAYYAECLAANRSDDGLTHTSWSLIHATAAKRAEAFLKTIEKWTA